MPRGSCAQGWRFPRGANHPASVEPSLPAGLVCLLDNVLNRVRCWFPDVRGSRIHLFHRSRDAPLPSTTGSIDVSAGGPHLRFWGSSPHQGWGGAAVKHREQPGVCSATKGFFFSNKIDQSECRCRERTPL